MLDLHQDNLWFLAALLSGTSAVLLLWPARIVERGRRIASVAGHTLLTGGCLAQLLWHQAGTSETLLQLDILSGSAFLMAAATLWAVRPSWLPKAVLMPQALLALTWPAPWIGIGWLDPLLQTDYLPGGFIRALLAATGSLLFLVHSWRRQPAPGTDRAVAPIVFGCILLTGSLLVGLVDVLLREREKSLAFTRAATLAMSLDGDAATALTVTPETHYSSAYRRLREQLLRLRRANPDIAYLYLVGAHEDSVVYPVSGAEKYLRENADGSVTLLEEPDQPFEIGPPLSERYRTLFKSDSPVWDSPGPIEFYGTLFSVLAPVRDSNGVRSQWMLGMDFRPAEFLRTVTIGRRLAQLLVVAAVLALGLFLRFQIHSEQAQRDRTAREAAEARERERELLLGMVSHELQTPLQPILGQARALRNGAMPADVADSIERHAGDLSRLLDDLLQAGALRSERFTIVARPCRLETLVREVAASLVPLASERGIRFELRLPTSGQRVQADPLRFRQVAANLISNAAKHAVPGQVLIELSLEPGSDRTAQVRLSVEDGGPGIPESARDRIFEPFSRMSPLTSASGTGLGLPVARALCRRMGGDISVEGTPANGTRFTATLSVLWVEESSEANAAQPPTRILLVEDHPHVRESLCELLEGLGHAVVAVGTAAEAFALLQQPGFEVVCIDSFLPDSRGHELVRKLRAAGCRSWIIGMSASRLPSVCEEFEAAGADDFINKPAHKEALREALAVRSTPEETLPPESDLEDRLVAGDPDVAAEIHRRLNTALAEGASAARLRYLRRLEERAEGGGLAR